MDLDQEANVKSVEDGHDTFEYKKFEDRARVYLARGETRLSTMHRVAGVFVGGAGLLTLIPFMLKDALMNIAGRIQNTLDVVSIVIAILIVTTLVIGVYALQCLFKDLVLFYFSPNHESQSTGVFLPRLSLSVLTIQLAVNEDDYTENIKKITEIRDEINNKQEEELFDFLLPKGKQDKYVNYENHYCPAIS